MIAFIFIRSRNSTNLYIRGQGLLLPIAISICAIETIEALLWALPQEELVSVLESSTHTCSTRNHRLTMLVAFLVLPFQPYLFLFPMRRVGHPRNRDLLRIPEALALIFAVTWCACLLVPVWRKDAPLVSLEDSGYLSYSHLETCAFVGREGHLHWAFRQMNSYMVPNGFPYFLTFLVPTLFVRPWGFFSGIVTVLTALGFAQLVYFGFSFEFGSVWCWSALLLHVYLVLQPYVMPLGTESLEASSFEVNSRNKVM